MAPSDPFFGSNNTDKTVIRPTPGGQRPGTPGRQVVFPHVLQDAVSFTDLKGDNPLLDNAYTLLSLVPKLRNLPYLNAVNELRGQLINELKKFENHVTGQHVPKSQMEIAKFLLCTLLDEAVLNTPWGSRSGWGHNSLSNHFFRKMPGGEEFFNILDQLKLQPEQNRNLLELAFLCLNLGFEGKYRYVNNGQNALENQRTELYQRIREIKPDDLPELSTHWQGFTGVSNPLIRHVPLWVFASVICVLLTIVYMLFAVSIRDRSDDIFGELSAMAQNIEKKPLLETIYVSQVQKPSTKWIDQLRTILMKDINQQNIEITDDGKLRIFKMFKSGNADVRYEYQPILAKIADILHKQNTQVRIIGHTDNRKLKFSSRFKSNWHLSEIRAENTAKALTNHGLPAENLRFEGKADKEPIAPNNTKANRERNRRIEIEMIR